MPVQWCYKHVLELSLSTELADTELADIELADFVGGHRTGCENTGTVFCIQFLFWSLQ